MFGGYLGRLVLAFRSFFAILFKGVLPEDIASEYGFAKKVETPKPAPVPEVRVSDGALQILGILQRDARFLDFVMEDIAGYSDDQVGAAVRNLHDECRKSLERYVTLAPVVDSIEGAPVKLEGRPDPAKWKLLGNVPADGRASGGVLRHRGWRAEKVDLPSVTPNQNPAILAPAEVEIE
jgi:hypothetical protein